MRAVNRDGIQLASLRSTSNGARPGALPSRIKILDWGVNKTLKGDFLVDDRTIEVFDATQRSVGRERIPLDYEHNTVPGTEEFKRSQEPRPIAAYFTPRVIRGEGVVLEAPRWVDKEETVLKFEDVSAAPFVQDGRVIGLHSCALTRAGASEFTFFSAPEIDALIQTLSASDFLMLGKNEAASANTMQLNLAKLATLMGLTETASEADVQAKLTGAVSLSARLESLEAKVTTLSTPSAGDVTKQIVDLRAEFKALSETATNEKRDAIIVAMSTAGQVPKKSDGTAYTADELKKLDVPLLQTLSANTPATVPLSARAGRAGNAPAPTDKGAAIRFAVAAKRQGTSLSYDEAYAAVVAEKPELFI